MHLEYLWTNKIHGELKVLDVFLNSIKKRDIGVKVCGTNETASHNWKICLTELQKFV